MCGLCGQRSWGIFLFVIILFVSIWLTRTRYVETSYSEHFWKCVIRGSIIGLAVVSIFIMWILSCRGSAITTPAHENIDGEPRQWHRIIRYNVKLFGIVLFFFNSFVLDFFRLIACWKCFDSWMACTSSVVRSQHMIENFYPMARIVYLFVELLFSVRFNGIHFCQDKWVLMGLATVEATNVFVWLDALIDETIVFSPGGNWADELSRCFNATGVNISDHFFQCYSRTTHEYELLESASPYLYPFIMEYLMLVAESVLEWFLGAAAPVEAAALDQNRLGENSPLIPDDGNRQADNVRSDGDAVNAPALADGRGVACCRLLQTVVDRCDRTCPQWACCRFLKKAVDRCEHTRFFFFVAVMIIISIIFVILGLYNLLLRSSSYLYGFTGYRLFFWPLLSLLALIGLWACGKFLTPEQCCHCDCYPCDLTCSDSACCRLWGRCNYVPRNLNNCFEGLLIVSAVGPIMQCIFSMVANLQSEGRIAMFLVDELFNLVQIITQILFYWGTKRISRCGGNILYRCHRRVLMSIVSFFVVCNFALWVEDSFIETRNSEISWEKQYFDNWPLWYNLFNPLSLWFRLNSALLFLNFLFDKVLASDGIKAETPRPRRRCSI